MLYSYMRMRYLVSEIGECKLRREQEGRAEIVDVFFPKKRKRFGNNLLSFTSSSDRM
jgi:hypothetical protein